MSYDKLRSAVMEAWEAVPEEYFKKFSQEYEGKVRGCNCNKGDAYRILRDLYITIISLGYSTYPIL
jgi:hypothetical protein